VVCLLYLSLLHWKLITWSLQVVVVVQAIHTAVVAVQVVCVVLLAQLAVEELLKLF
jgi:hypothetical protein